MGQVLVFLTMSQSKTLSSGSGLVVFAAGSSRGGRKIIRSIDEKVWLFQTQTCTVINHLKADLVWTKLTKWGVFS